uniref:Uncharacterized protein n=1 Tax=Timema monikensis TaxID=170555 RepID=A0A7R9EH98_9NEOP|nr:unnamed protein product [Timema monikensis]
MTPNDKTRVEEARGIQFCGHGNVLKILEENGELPVECTLLKNEDWIWELAFLTDIMGHLNNLNQRLQERQNTWERGTHVRGLGVRALVVQHGDTPLCLSRRSLSKMLRPDLRFHTYKVPLAQELSQHDIVRLQCCLMCCRDHVCHRAAFLENTVGRVTTLNSERCSLVDSAILKTESPKLAKKLVSFHQICFAGTYTDFTSDCSSALPITVHIWLKLFQMGQHSPKPFEELQHKSACSDLRSATLYTTD